MEGISLGTVVAVFALLGGGGVIGLMGLAVRHGRVLQRLEVCEGRLEKCASSEELKAIRAQVDQCVQLTRWIDFTQHLGERIKTVVQQIETVEERLHQIETTPPRAQS